MLGLTAVDALSRWMETKVMPRTPVMITMLIHFLMCMVALSEFDVWCLLWLSKLVTDLKNRLTNLVVNNLFLLIRNSNFFCFGIAFNLDHAFSSFKSSRDVLNATFA